MRSTVPQHCCAARCVGLRILLADERTRLCTARAGCDHAVRACEGQAAAGDRAPLDFEDGEMAARCTTSLAPLSPTAPRRAWQLANSASQLVTPDASWGVIWAWHTTPNVNSATRIAARLLQRRLLQRTREESAATMTKPGICSEGRMRSLTSVSAYG